MKSIGNFFLEFIQSVVMALSIFVIFYLFIGQPNEVKGSSMVPNFTDGEYILTDKVTYYFRKPENGDVVIFKAPASEACSVDECEYIKRIIAKPGDKVMVKNKKVFVNGIELNEKYLPVDFETNPGSWAEEGVEKIIPDDYYLCLGDNRSHSRDGREFGPVERKAIVGKALLKYWPPKSIGLIPAIR